ncbi:glycosyltransferase family 24 protein [Cercospora zeae-maydis SCOH1-5]|uniref:Glycosyltransferase family 24 protein n=1 Tax=Cercospora zeae-maydis SCOH1-5 TaxID=717836 RepID=A0A6A6FJ96_9PEZI|nr:glycosyltransferase family 24 protein [Cercospora zeae-maydis SCOH1-5]
MATRSWGNWKAAALASLLTYSNALPSVNVAVRAAFGAPPFLVELLETAAEENSTAYFPLLDRIADGYFDSSTTDEQLYKAFRSLLQSDGHLGEDDLSSFDYALAIHSAAPRIEAHYQYYNTSVVPTISKEREGYAGCDTWVYVPFSGQKYCSPDLNEKSAESLGQPGDSVKQLPFDRILGDVRSEKPSILYADLLSESFRKFHKTLSQTAKEGKTSYRVRYRAFEGVESRPLTVSGYGVELALKRTDYIVIDDRQDGENAEKDEGKSAAETTLSEEEVSDLRPLSQSELRKLGVRAASFVMGNEDPFATLLKLSQDFPKHSTSIAATNISKEFINEHAKNREVLLPPGYNVMWINGVQVMPRDVEAYALLEHLRRERKMIKSVQQIGLSGSEAIQLLSHEAITEAQVEQDAPRYDWRDEAEGGDLIVWLNDLEKDKRYADWPKSANALLQRTFPGQLPPVRKEVHNLVLPVDFADFNDVLLVSEQLRSFVQRQVPIRMGLVPRVRSETSEEQTAIIYYLVHNYGLGTALKYLEQSLEAAGRRYHKPNEKVFQAVKTAGKLRPNKEDISLENVLKDTTLSDRVARSKKYISRIGSTDPTPPVLINGAPIARTEDWLQVMSQQVSVDLRAVQQAVYTGELGDDDYLPTLFLSKASFRRNPLVVPEDDKSLNFLNLGDHPELEDLPSIPADPKTIERELVHLTVVADLDSEQGFEQVMEAMLYRREHDNVEVAILHVSRDGDSESRVLSDLQKSGADGVLEALMAQYDSLHTGDDDLEARRKIYEKAVIANGRVVGPVSDNVAIESSDIETLLTYERTRRLLPAALAIEALGLQQKASTPLSFARISNLIALSLISDVPEGIFEAAPTVRTDVFKKFEFGHTAINIGDLDTATIQIYAAVDPASEAAQKWIPIIKVLSEFNGVHVRLFLNPRERIEEIPIKRFYRHVLSSKPSFEADGSLAPTGAQFRGLPADALLNMGMDLPPAWLVAPEVTVHDLDNIKLSAVKNDIEAVYQLEHILIEGHSRDATIGPPPRGAQLVLGTDADPHFADTIIMANLGYFQFKANPGIYSLAMQKGRSEEIFHIDSAGASGYDPQGRLGDGAQKFLGKAAKLGSGLLSKSGSASTTPERKHADINIFSVASGHLYERMLNIMMVSVMKHTKHSVKFWFIEQFLSPSFKDFLPVMAETYGFEYEMVTYKWPHWLRGQKEKQREIWGYKILFLDVLFPLDLDKVIFVDADQIVRTDMYELVQHDLQGAPYGFTPMCDSRTEMEGFRFWKQGYWKNFLKGLPYHISALYVVDLKRFRQMAAGDRLRQNYHQLSADPNSLSNLDQDLPNHMQALLPIHSLPQEWLWCETWCSDESLKDAKTIDLCNNPQTKEPKLERARRQVPEWNEYDEEIGGLAKRWREEKRRGVESEGLEGESVQESLQREDAEREKRKGKRDEL